MGLKRSVEGDEKSRKEGGSAPEIRSPWAGYKTRLPLPGRALPVTAEEGSRHGRRGRSAAGARGWGEQWGSPLRMALLERSLERRHRQGTSTGCIARAVQSTAASRRPLHSQPGTGRRRESRRAAGRAGHGETHRARQRVPRAGPTPTHLATKNHLLGGNACSRCLAAHPARCQA